MKKDKRTTDLVGQRFGRLLVLSRSETTDRGRAYWHCICDCGATRDISADNLKRGMSTSCGCKRGDSLSIHGGTRKGQRRPEYSVWAGMIERCTNPRRDHWYLYGGRGITVCRRWESFANFLADMGPRPSTQHSIERRDTDGNYEPSNCCWATASEQQNNTKRNRIFDICGERLTLVQAIRKYSTDRYGTVHARLTLGWDIYKALGIAPPTSYATLESNVPPILSIRVK